MSKPNDLLLVDRLAEKLREQIVEGEYGKSGVIPSITELALEWGVKNRGVVTEVIMLLRAQGYLVQTPKRHFRVVNPLLELEGLTPNFRTYLEDKGCEVEELDIITPQVEAMPSDVARMFCDNTKTAVIKEGVHVVHRLRRQGLIDLPLRLGHIWYPLNLAQPYLEAMQKDSSFDFLAALKRDSGMVVVKEDFSIQGRIPDSYEAKELRLARYQPLLEVRRICYSDDNRVIALHRTIMDATRFQYKISRPTNWK